jgi:hypothetical protein
MKHSTYLGAFVAVLCSPNPESGISHHQHFDDEDKAKDFVARTIVQNKGGVGVVYASKHVGNIPVPEINWAPAVGSVAKS